ncbi:MAG: septation protein A [Burkholderiales bacterium]|nr:septation protein A [Burkholderiales bacterium]
MKAFFDFLPVLAFFAVYWASDIYVATAAAIAATLAQVGWLWLRRRPVEPMLWASLALVLVFGGLTLALRDPLFIQWKPTVLYWLFAAVLAVSSAVFDRNLIRAALAKELRLPEPVWQRLNWSWVAFFLLMGAANLAVAYRLSEAAWVRFKLFGGIGLMLLFVLGQALVLGRYLERADEREDLR